MVLFGVECLGVHRTRLVDYYVAEDVWSWRSSWAFEEFLKTDDFMRGGMSEYVYLVERSDRTVLDDSRSGSGSVLRRHEHQHEHREGRRATGHQREDSTTVNVDHHMS